MMPLINGCQVQNKKPEEKKKKRKQLAKDDGWIMGAVATKMSRNKESGCIFSPLQAPPPPLVWCVSLWFRLIRLKEAERENGIFFRLTRTNPIRCKDTTVSGALRHRHAGEKQAVIMTADFVSATLRRCVEAYRSISAVRECQRRLACACVCGQSDGALSAFALLNVCVWYFLKRSPHM